MLFGIISVVVTLILVATQKYLSRKKNWLLGAVVPIVSAALMVGIFFYKDFPLSWKTILPCAFIFALEVLIWIDQRIEHRRNELNKMKAEIFDNYV